MATLNFNVPIETTTGVSTEMLNKRVSGYFNTNATKEPGEWAAWAKALEAGQSIIVGVTSMRRIIEYIREMTIPTVIKNQILNIVVPAFESDEELGNLLDGFRAGFYINPLSSSPSFSPTYSSSTNLMQYAVGDKLVISGIPAMMADTSFTNVGYFYSGTNYAVSLAKTSLVDEGNGVYSYIIPNVDRQLFGLTIRNSDAATAVVRRIPPNS